MSILSDVLFQHQYSRVENIPNPEKSYNNRDSNTIPPDGQAARLPPRLDGRTPALVNFKHINNIYLFNN